MAKSSAKTKANAVNALDFLADPSGYSPACVCAVYGDEDYLKREALGALRRQVFSGEEAESALRSFEGRSAVMRDVLDALATMTLFGGGRRMVVVEDADSFVSQYRGELEAYVARPVRAAVLVLDVKTWPSNTRLAKAIAADGLAIECAAPKERQLKTWLVSRAKAAHQMQLEAAAADALLELVPPELGILVQELDKLALIVDERRVIDVKIVRENVGGWRARTTWEMIDAAADGRTALALAQLDRLISAGEKPHGLLPQVASSFRRFAVAAQLIESAEGDGRRLPLRNALAQAGVLPFKLSDAERQLRQIGRQRGKQITRWLLAADLAMKGHNSSDDRARTELERLLVRVAHA
jgi:DNA polymerase-3 subunit delta